MKKFQSLRERRMFATVTITVLVAVGVGAGIATGMSVREAFVNFFTLDGFSAPLLFVAFVALVNLIAWVVRPLRRSSIGSDETSEM
jgi:cyanate permease